MRLAGGSTFHDGRVEIYHQGAWGPVCREGWSQADSSVACRELGFQKPVVTGGDGGSEFFWYLCKKEASLLCSFDVIFETTDLRST